MARDSEHKGEHLRLFRTAEHPCSYLHGLEAGTLFIDPEAEKRPALYQSLLDMGFRRSGGDIYRPDCQSCKSCISVRIPVERFSPRRSQRRVWNLHQNNLDVTTMTAGFHPEHFELYSKYINSRHPEGEMANPTEDDYRRFLIAPWCNARFIEFRADGKLISVAVIDILPQGVSAVYTFFDPEMSALSPGVLAILWQIEETRRFGLPWLYLGYWVKGCQKMEYKQDYRPMQVYSEGVWKEFSTTEAITIPELLL